MLEDRSYMRQPSFGSRRSATIMLLIINVAAFMGQVLVSSLSRFPAQEYFALSVEGLRHAGGGHFAECRRGRPR